ncbi:MAG: hypothetical protein JSW11_18215 [Candidatus Heimdallarchaeota archaeon]|nr:MAG: hypothetical protein JSW11_18215 [Candidatus Heimdallarchaeota archaeon]
MSQKVISRFSEFLQEIENQCKNISTRAAGDWEKTIKEGILTTFLRDTITGIEDQYSKFLQDEQRKSTLLSNIYEIVTSHLIKSFFESLDRERFSIILDTPLSAHSPSLKKGRMRPDILVKRDGTFAGLIELKYKLKRTGYVSEKKRRSELLAIFPRYIVLQYWDQEIEFVKSLIREKCDWIYLVDPHKQIEQIQNSQKFNNIQKQQAIDRLNTHNAVELALNNFI